MEAGGANIFGMEITGAEKLALKTALLSKSIKENLEKTMYAQGVIIENRAKEILRTVHWETKGGLWRGRHKVKGKTSKATAGRGNAIYYPPGSRVIGHIDRGRLLSSIHTQTTIEPYVLQVQIGTDNSVPYAKYVEKLRDGGFLKPAYRENVKNVRQELQKKIKEVIKFVAGKKV